MKRENVLNAAIALAKRTDRWTKKSNQNCDQIFREIRELGYTLEGILNDIEKEQSELSRLRHNRNLAIAEAAAGALTAAGGAFASALRAGRMVQNIASGSRPNLASIARLLPGVGSGIIIVTSGLRAYDSIQEISLINDNLNDLSFRADGLVRYIADIERMAESSGCTQF